MGNILGLPSHLTATGDELHINDRSLVKEAFVKSVSGAARRNGRRLVVFIDWSERRVHQWRLSVMNSCEGKS